MRRKFRRAHHRQVQFHDAKGSDIEQFRVMVTQTVPDACRVQVRQPDLPVRKGEVIGILFPGTGFPAFNGGDRLCGLRRRSIRATYFIF
jgi:hypothetical protein